MMFWGTISSAWKNHKVMVKHCGQLYLTVSDDSACDEETFVKKMNRSCWVNLSHFEELRCRSYRLILFYKSTVGSAVIEAYFALFSMEARRSGLTSYETGIKYDNRYLPLALTHKAPRKQTRKLRLHN